MTRVSISVYGGREKSEGIRTVDRVLQGSCLLLIIVGLIDKALSAVHGGRVVRRRALRRTRGVYQGAWLMERPGNVSARRLRSKVGWRAGQGRTLEMDCSSAHAASHYWIVHPVSQSNKNPSGTRKEGV